MILLNVEYLSYNEITDVAYNFSASHKIEDKIPVPIEEVIEFDLNIDIVPIPSLQRDFDIEGFSSSDFSCIFVDEYVYKEREYRYRFTLAHELGHFALHKNLFEQYKFESVEDWKAFVSQVDQRDYDKFEFQGYAFAGLFIFPPEHLRRLFWDALNEILPDIEQAKSRQIKREKYLNYATESIARTLVPIFKASTGAITRRIARDGLENEIP